MDNDSKTVPTLFIKREECCGCTACYSVCPKGAIQMQADAEGFEYPVIESLLCIKCYVCVKVCPIKNNRLAECDY